MNYKAYWGWYDDLRPIGVALELLMLFVLGREAQMAFLYTFMGSTQKILLGLVVSYFPC